MKKMILLLFAILMFSMTSYAGQWEQDAVGWRYQNDDGTYKIGWHQDVDGKWYYLDDQTTYMLSNAITPDGYSVNESGEWTNKENVSQSEYDNKEELTVSSTSFPGGGRQFGYSFPVTIHYNNKYGEITVTKIELSKEGTPFIVFSTDGSKLYELSVKCKYSIEDGTTVDDDDTISVFCEKQNEVYSKALIKAPYKILNGPKVTTAEIWVDKAE